MKRSERAALALALMSVSLAAVAADDPMIKLASGSGCFACHQVEPGGKGPDGMAPIGPAWREVSAKYAGASGAVDQLTRTVMSGSNPYASHWKGKVSGLAMPPNAVAISEADARQLVTWILALKPSK